MKKIIFIILGVIVVGVAVWFFFFFKISPSQKISTNSNGSPFGTAPGDNSSSGNTAGTGTNTSGTPANGQAPTLFKVSGDPVAGAVVFLKNKVETIRYVDRATGHIYDVDPLTLTKIEITNNTLPKIYQAFFKPDGSQVIFRSLPDNSDTPDNVSLTLTAPKSTSTGAEYTASSINLRGNISAISAGPTKIAYVLGDTGAVGISGFAGENPQTVFSSAYHEWQVAWSGANLELTTNASASAQGSSYILNSTNGSLARVAGPLLGLTALPSPTGGQVVYSYIDANGKASFSVINTKTGASSSIVPATFAEKCAWSLKSQNIIFCGTPSGIGGNEPDSWYAGITHFSDQVWRFDTASGNATLLADPKINFNVDLDVINPSLSPNEDYLIFMNKTDLSLWVLKLS